MITQQVNVQLILEVDATLSKEQIVNSLLKQLKDCKQDGIHLVDFELQEEAEIYGDE